MGVQTSGDELTQVRSVGVGVGAGVGVLVVCALRRP